MFNQPAVLSHTMVTKALADPRFHNLVPEFKLLRTRLPIHKLEQLTRSCSGCHHVQAVQDLYREFIATVFEANPEARVRLKAYFNVPGLMMNRVDPKRNKIELKII